MANAKIFIELDVDMHYRPDALDRIITDDREAIQGWLDHIHAPYGFVRSSTVIMLVPEVDHAA